MLPITLKIVASLLQLHGPSATLTSDHAGIANLLEGVRDQLAKRRESGADEQKEASYNSYDDYEEYDKHAYSKWTHAKTGAVGSPGSLQGGAINKPITPSKPAMPSQSAPSRHK